jgi:hypothetical protein
MSKLTDEARGRECLIRIPDVCNGNPETTVPCHFRMLPLCGTGAKMDDYFVAWGCSSCHDEVDRRTQLKESDYVRMAFLEGIIRTQAQLIKEGKIKA